MPISPRAFPRLLSLFNRTSWLRSEVIEIAANYRHQFITKARSANRLKQNRPSDEGRSASLG
ncbi:MAG: hypothetical protein U0X93_17985 [Anaerolineales bacterium]